MAARSRSSRPSGFPLRRVVTAGILLVIAALYVSPVQKYLRVQRQLAEQGTLVRRLERQHQALVQRVAALHGKTAIVQCARQRGWVFPGETTLIVTGLPAAAGDRSC
jgi:cell division protein FtsB